MLLYALTVFLSALLLFQVEMIVAKYILPWFGGVATVWTVCMLFFQVLLTLGYAYSHLIVSKLSFRQQGHVHLALLAAAAAALLAQFFLWPAPILADPGWKPEGSDFPTLRILLLLTVSLGLPFFVLSTTSSLAQAWFSGMWPGRSPYGLYAVSNVGSLLGLLGYPFLVEPSLTLRTQGRLWAAIFGLFVLGCAVCAWRARRIGRTAPVPQEEIPRSESSGDGPPGWKDCALWLILAFVPSVLLLATTNMITEEITVVPFLWVIPLCVYLLSFVLCFQRWRWYFRKLYVVMGFVAIFMFVVTMLDSVKEESFKRMCVAYSFALFVCCMICHGELADRRPQPRHLTLFYFMVSIGGMLGGVFVGVVAPAVFDHFWELYIGYFGCAAAFVVVMVQDRQSAFRGRFRVTARVAAALVLLGLAAMPYFVHTYQTYASFDRVWERMASIFGLQMYAAVDTEGRCEVIATRRNFYGRLRVKEWFPRDPERHERTLSHGRTTHGCQAMGDGKRGIATSYFGEGSGVEMAISNRQSEAWANGLAGLRIGVLGLGAGTLATYGRAGDYVRFYEINPAVIGLATGRDAYFTFVGDSRARIDIITGDARLSMEREAPQQFDVLAIDAFNGDSPPVHLLTREAVGVYLRHLKQDGILALHISNRFLSLEPVVWKLADAWGLHCVLIRAKAKKSDEFCYSSVWMLLTRDDSLTSDPRISRAASPRKDTPRTRSLRLWTDDYSNLFQLL